MAKRTRKILRGKGSVLDRGEVTLTAKDWTLLVIAAGGSKGVQPVQLQKSLFLLGRNLTLAQLHVAAFYEFEPYDYGPFCGQVYRDEETLNAEGLVHVDHLAHLSYRVYSVTDEGRSAVSELRQSLEPEVQDYLDKVVRWSTSLTFKQLVSAIYRAFPETKVNSVFQE